jgi:hypothetical protein
MVHRRLFSALSDSKSSLEGFNEEAAEYRRVLVDEIANHKMFSRIAIATGFGLILLGVLIGIYLPSLATLGYLLVLVGALRFLNTFYDMQREDKLQVELRRLDQQFKRL